MAGRACIALLSFLLLPAAPAAAQSDVPFWQQELQQRGGERPEYGEDWTRDGWDESALDLPAVPWRPGGGATPAAPPSLVLPAPVSGRLVAGRTARMRTDGTAAVPRSAPARVRRLISALNEIVGKPYVWGGGHGRLIDRGYDCSGAVSYGLIRTAMLSSPLVSGSLARWAAPGAGRWVSVYANAGHVYLEVAGLRLDTSPVGDATRRHGVRWRPPIGRRPGFVARHPAGL